MENKETCEGNRGGNICGRKGEFYIEDMLAPKTRPIVSCQECIGRILIQEEIDEATISRI